MTAIWHPDGTLRTRYTYLHNFRESIAYQWTLRRFKKDVLPAFFGIVSLAAIVLISISGASRIFFSLADSTGLYCKADASVPSATITTTYSKVLTFSPVKPCWPSGLLAQKGASYRVVLDITDTAGSWKDDTLKADLLGNREDHRPDIGITAWFTKRYLWEKYYKPIARIRNTKANATGQDEYILNPTFGSSEEHYKCLVSDFTAQSSGELFFFVNDAIVYARPNLVTGTYDNNKGTADVYVKRIAIAGEPFALPEKMATTSACKEFVFTPPQVVPTVGQ
jgi:hypothetical protein